MSIGEISSEPLSPRDIMDQATILALRQISDNVATQGRAMERMVEEMKGVNTQLARIDGAQYDQRLQTLEKELGLLRSANDRRTGGAQLVEYISKVGPWIAAIALGVLGWMNKGGKIG